MPTFQYAARDRAGKKVQGTLAGLDERAIRGLGDAAQIGGSEGGIA